MRSTKLLLAFILLTVSAWAQTSALTANVHTLAGGTSVAGVKVRFELRTNNANGVSQVGCGTGNLPRVVGGGGTLLNDTSWDYTPDASGLITGQTIYRNDTPNGIDCAGLGTFTTYYWVYIVNSGSKRFYGQYIVNTPTFNLNTAAQTVTVPTGSSTSGFVDIISNQTIGGNKSFTSAVNFAGSSGLPATVGSGGYIAGGFTSPTANRFYCGDGSGWQCEFVKRSSSVDTVLYKFKDSGILDILAGLTIAGSAPSGNVLRGDGSKFVSSALAFTDLSGTLAINKGGTGQTTAAAAFNALSPLTTSGDVLYGGASGAGTRLAANGTATKKYLQSVSSGIPAWQQIAAADLSNGVNGSGAVALVSSPTIDNIILTGSSVLNTTFGAQWFESANTEVLTLSTSGTSTDTSANLLPQNAVIEAVVARVGTTITTATNWELGDVVIPGRFSAPSSSLTVGSQVVGLVHVDQTGTAGPRQTSTGKVRVTTTGIPSAGSITITVFFRQYFPPTF